MSGGVAGGRIYWVRSEDIHCTEELKIKGIIVIFAWVSSITKSQLKDYVNFYTSLGWNSLVCLSDFLNPFIPERATSLAFSVLNELVEELRSSMCPIVLAASSGGSKACMYKFFQVKSTHWSHGHFDAHEHTLCSVLAFPTINVPDEDCVINYLLKKLFTYV